MVNKVIFVSRWCAEATGPWPDWAMISITEPDAVEGRVLLQKGWHSVLSLSFHDVDPQLHPEDSHEFVFMSDDEARQIVEFVDRVGPEVEGIVVHCRAGISRSAAVAKWIAGQYRIPFDSGYKRYNVYVYQKLVEAGKALRGRP